MLFGTTGGVMEAALRTVYELVSGQPMGRVVFEEARGLDGVKEGTVRCWAQLQGLERSPGHGLQAGGCQPPPAHLSNGCAVGCGQRGTRHVSHPLLSCFPPPPTSPAPLAPQITIPVGPDSPFKALEPAPGAVVALRIAVANGLGSAKKLIKGIADGSSAYDFVEVMACPGGCIGGGGQPRSADKGILGKRQVRGRGAGLTLINHEGTAARSGQEPERRQLTVVPNCRPYAGRNVRPGRAQHRPPLPREPLHPEAVRQLAGEGVCRMPLH